MSDMNILVATNRKYLFPMKVMLYSLSQTNKKENINVHIFHASLTVEEENRLTDEISRYVQSVHIYRIGDEIFEDAHTELHFTKECYFRLLAAELLPDNLERVLYLDSDIIILKGLEELYNYDMDQALFAAAPDSMFSESEEKKKDLGIPPEYLYVNTGVLLINLVQMREKFNLTQVMQYISDNASKLQYVDQEVINAMFYNDIKYFSESKYNRSIMNILNKNQIYQDDINILHYSGCEKPWDFRVSLEDDNIYWKNACSIRKGKTYWLKHKILRIAYKIKHIR